MTGASAIADLDYEELLRDDAKFALQFARHYVVTAEEAAKIYGFLGVSASPRRRWNLHAEIAAFIEAGIAQASDRSPETLVRTKMAMVAAGDHGGLVDNPESLGSGAGAVVASALSLGLPHPSNPAEIMRYSEEMVERAKSLAKTTKRPPGAQANLALDGFLVGLGNLAEDVGAAPGVGNNDRLDEGDVSPFVMFVEEGLLAACERAERVLDARRDGGRDCANYFADVSRLAKDKGSRRLADAIRRARKREKIL